MKVVKEGTHWWAGRYVGCQYCGAISQFDGLSHELSVHTPGDMKDESTLSFTCPSCGQSTITTYSRIMGDQATLKKALVN